MTTFGVHPPTKPPDLLASRSLLRSTLPFATLSDELIDVLTAGLTWICVPGGEAVPAGAEAAGSAFVVLHGRVRLIHPHPRGSPGLHHGVGPGVLIGGLALLTGGEHLFRAVAVRD